MFVPLWVICVIFGLLLVLCAMCFVLCWAIRIQTHALSKAVMMRSEPSKDQVQLQQTARHPHLKHPDFESLARRIHEQFFQSTDK